MYVRYGFIKNFPLDIGSSQASFRVVLNALKNWKMILSFFLDVVLAIGYNHDDHGDRITIYYI